MYVDYTVKNNSSYDVEIRIDKDYRKLEKSKELTEKRFNSPHIELINDAPVKISSGYKSAYITDKKLYSMLVLNTFSDYVIFSVEQKEYELTQNEEIEIYTSSYPKLENLKCKNKNYPLNTISNIENNVIYFKIY